MSHILKEFIDLYTQPEREQIEVAGLIFNGDSKWVHIHRTQNAIEFIIDEHDQVNSNPMNVIVPVIEEAREHLSNTNYELIRRRPPFLTQYQLHRAVARGRDLRAQPLICEAMVQQLPIGERLSVSIIGMNSRMTERLYGAVANLEQAMMIHGVRFDSLPINSLILGADGRLYPYRYDTIKFVDKIEGCDSLDECDDLRRKIELSTGHAAKQSRYPAERSPYRNTLCDTYGGYISCRTLSEGLIAVESETGWGFVDEMHNVVIKPKYMSVSDFSDGHAAVQLTHNERYGLIDREGDFILKPIYTLIEIDPESGDITLEREHIRVVMDREGVVR